MLGVASMGTFMLNLDACAARVFMLPMLVPNAVVLLAQYGSTGLFGGVALLAFVAILLKETGRAQRRIDELLTLRFTTEQVSQERAEALELAQHHSEAKSRFLATMSHEMRTPLHGMLGLTRLLREDERRPEVIERLSLIERSGEHLLSVINDVLDTSRIESDRVRIEQHAFDLMAVIHDVAGVTRVPAQAKGLRLVVESSLPHRHEVLGDAARVRQVLHNLLGNAVKFTDQGQICLRVRRVPDSQLVAVEVQDTGIGIPAHELPHIFEAFHQVENSMERRHGGTGLGLTISQKLCRAMGGDLRCESAPGVGSTFVAMMSLPEAPSVPVHESDEARLAPLAASSHASPGLSGPFGLALLVEDNAVNAMVAEASLKQFGVAVQLAEDGPAALVWLAEHEPDVVLLDCQMPGMDGYEVASRIRELEARTGRRRVPIVALTANAHPQARAHCLAAGMDDHLGKPFHRHDLARVLSAYLKVPGGLGSGAAQATESEPEDPFVSGLLRHAV